MIMQRTSSEKEAFAEGYLLCYQQFEKYLKDGTPVELTLETMGDIAKTVQAVVKSAKEEGK